MTGSLLAGLGIGLVGALLLATGMDLQSRAVQAADGSSREWLRDRRWWTGLALLASAVGTNLVALALAPVSAVQSVNIIALAVALLLPAGALASMLLQRAHRDLAAPAVLAGATLTDSLTAAVIGILVLGESTPTPSASMLLLACAAIAVLGVLGLRRGLPAAGSDPEGRAPVRAGGPVLAGRHRVGEGPGRVQDPALVDLRPGES